MIIIKSYISKGGSEVTLECEFREKYTITLADAKRLGLYGLEEDEFPIEFRDDELIMFLAEKLKAIRYALYLLGFSDKSEKILRMKMKEKEYSQEVIDEALGVMKSSGYLSDEDMSLKKYVSIASSKKYGPRRIKSELYSKGFSDDDIRNAEANTDIDFEALLYDLCEKLLSNGRTNLCDKEAREKFKAKLLRYGYCFDMIDKVLRDFSQTNGDY